MNSNLKNRLIAVLVITLASQFYIDVLFSDFRVSGGVIAFAILMYFFRDIHPVGLGIAVSITTYIWRVILYVGSRGYSPDIIDGFAPEILFYLLYSIVFWYLSQQNKDHDMKRYFLVIILSDLSANIMEIIIHFLMFDEMLTKDVLIILPVVALIRSSVVWLFIKGTRYYQMLVLVEEQADRYNKLVWLSMNLKSEVYWMAKNMDKIEETMSHAYNLFENIQGNHSPETWAEHSVELASDVHEIKKDYELIMRGVTEITEFRFQDKGMQMHNIMKLVEVKINKAIKQFEYNINLEFELGSNFYTDKHYQLMSVFRNLFMNAVESIGPGEAEDSITFIHSMADAHHIFQVTDSGGGISPEDIDEIFTPGFSTKINYETGEINRGLGLSFVKDMIEKTLKGTIKVQSNLDDGTTFIIKIPKSELEV